VIAIDPDYVTVECTNQLMKQVDFVVATGGTPMVRVAYSSGTPTIGVGTGNVTTYIDSTADVDEAADKIKRSNVFDNSSSCSAENSLVIDEAIYDKFIAALERAGGFIVREGSGAKEKLQKAFWPKWPEDHVINREIPGRSPAKIAEIAGIDLPAEVSFIAIEENGGFGHSFPFTGEKLSPVTTLVKAKDFEDGLDKMEAILEYQGKGHSCGIHTTDDEKIDKLALRMKVSRILVNQPHCLGNSGAYFNGMPFTMSLGCGTWGHNSTNNNVTWKDVVNYTLVSKPFDMVVPDVNELFPEKIRNVAFPV
jgi:sulfoacetaldehyde dehydrogenase